MMFDKIGDITPATQVRTWAMVTLRIGFGVALPGAGAAWAGGDAVPDGDLLRAEAFQVAREFEVGVLGGGLRVERVELAAQAGLAGARS